MEAPEVPVSLFVGWNPVGLRGGRSSCSRSSSNPRRHTRFTPPPGCPRSRIRADEADGFSRWCDQQTPQGAERFPGGSRKAGTGRPENPARRLPADDGRGGIRRRGVGIPAWWVLHRDPSVRSCAGWACSRICHVLTSRRRSKFDEQLPDTLQMLTGSMRAGHSLLRAIDASAQESDAPMSEELSRIINETRIGRDLGESMIDVSKPNRQRGLLPGFPKPSRSTGKWAGTLPKYWTTWAKQSGTATRSTGRSRH